jgi:hypothetical protein
MANIDRNDGVLISWGEVVEPLPPEVRIMSGQVTDRRFRATFAVQDDAQLRTIYINFDELLDRMVSASTSSAKEERIRALVFQFVENKLRFGRIPENDERFFMSESDVISFNAQVS